jgi:5,10-methylenetetrahydromethanopterin reductase
MASAAQPKVGIIFKSYEPLSSIRKYAALTDDLDFAGGFWMAEAYHWFRQYGQEARGVFATLAAVALSTKRIPVGLGITSPYRRHPTVQASEACAIDELSGGRFIMGLGAGKVGLNYLEQVNKSRPAVRLHRESIEIFRKIVQGDAFAYEGELYASQMPAIAAERRGHRPSIPLYIGATGPLMQKLAGEISDGLLLAGLVSPGFTRLAHANLLKGFEKAGRPVDPDFPLGGVVLCSVARDGKAAKDAARSYTATYVVNKIRNIGNDDILTASGVTAEELAPLRARLASGEEDLTDLVTDAMMRKFAVVAGDPVEAAEILQGLIDAGMNLPLLEVVGADEAANLQTIRLLGAEVLPKLNPMRVAA